MTDFPTAASAADRAERRSGWALLAYAVGGWGIVAGLMAIIWRMLG